MSWGLVDLQNTLWSQCSKLLLLDQDWRPACSKASFRSSLEMQTLRPYPDLANENLPSDVPSRLQQRALKAEGAKLSFVSENGPFLSTP